MFKSAGAKLLLTSSHSEVFTLMIWLEADRGLNDTLLYS